MDRSPVVVRPLADPHNKLVRTVRRLQASRAQRQRLGQTVLEGPRLIAEAMACRVPLVAAVYSPRLLQDDAGYALITELSGTGCRLVYATDELLAELSAVEHSQGILAVAQFAVPEAPLAVSAAGGLWVVAEGIQDPGNLGTLIRSAAGAGASAVGLAPGTVDAANPKALRASAGAAFRVPLVRLGEAGLAALEGAGVAVYVADAHGGDPYEQLDWTPPLVLWLGNEARGPSAVAGARRVHIPLAAGVESLNVAMAATVLLFHARARRRAAGLA